MLTIVGPSRNVDYTLRDDQEKIVNQCTTLIDAASGPIVIDLSAPTGSGKSLIAMALAERYAQMYPQICTPQLYLQDQYDDTFALARCVRGAKHYTCDKHGYTAEVCDIRSREAPPMVCQGCDYRESKMPPTGGDVDVANTAIWGSRRISTSGYSNPGLLLIDESHQFEDSLASSLEISLPRIKAFDNLPTGILTTGELAEYKGAVSKTIERIKKRFDALPAREKTSKRKAQVARTVQMWGLLKRLLDQVTAAPFKGYTYGHTTWIVEDTDTHRIFRPRDPIGTRPDVLWPNKPIVVGLSATPDGSMASIARAIGAKYHKVSMASTFKANRRPVLFHPIASMSRRGRAAGLPLIANEVNKLLLKYRNVRVIVHTHSFDITRKLDALLQKKSEGARVLAHTGGGKETILEHFTNPLATNTVLLSPSVAEGFDGKHSTARVNIVVKCPYPDISDKYVALRKSEDPSWYRQKAVSKLVQASGRVMRAQEDYGITYILDKDADLLYKKDATMFPDWFHDGVDAGAKMQGKTVRRALI